MADIGCFFLAKMVLRDYSIPLKVNLKAHWSWPEETTLTPLMIAVRRSSVQHLEIVKILLERSDIDVDL